MIKDHVKMLKNLDKVLLDDAGETPAEVRQRLEADGVDVKGLIARIKGAAGEAYRQRLTADARQAQVEATKSKGKVFGNLVSVGREKLLELIQAALPRTRGKSPSIKLLESVAEEFQTSRQNTNRKHIWK